MTVIPPSQITVMDKLIRDAVRNDGWEFWMIWGVKRYGKTTLGLGCSYRFYHDWKKVFEYMVFDMEGIMKLVSRYEDDPFYKIPLVYWDDPGVYASKYKFRDPLTIEFLEYFVAIAQHVAVLIVSAPLPTKILMGLRDDITASIFLPRRGYYIFQRHVWQDNYRSLTPRFKKVKLTEGPFPPIPQDVYKQYQILRHQFLVRKKHKRFKTMQEEDIAGRLNPIDWGLLEYMYEKHDVTTRVFQKDGGKEHLKGSLNKLEAYGLVIIHDKRAYITDLGEEVYLKRASQSTKISPHIQ